MNGFYAGSGGFRRRQRAEDGPTKTSLEFDLGTRLASFKSSPLLQLADVSEVRRVRSNRFLFNGACKKCTPNSATDTFSHEEPPIISQHGIANILRTNFTPIDPDQIVEKSVDKAVTLDTLRYQVEKRNGLISLMDEEVPSDRTPSTDILLEVFSRLSLKLKPNPVKLLTRLLQKVTEWLLGLLYPRGIVYHPGQLEVIARAMVSEDPMVFVPVETSSLDLVIIQLVLMQLKISPVIVSTNDDKSHNSTTNNPLLSSFETGSLQVLPWTDVDETNDHFEYNWAVQSMTTEGLLKAGHDFILSLVSRSKPTVKDCSKRGDLLFLQILIDQIVNVGEVKDIVVVPVTVTKDDPVNIVGKGTSLTIWQILKILCGRLFTPSASMARIDFEQPFKLSEMIENSGLRSTDEYDAVPALVEYVVSHILWSTTRLKRFNAGQLVAFLQKSPALFVDQDSCQTQLYRRLDHLHDEILNRGLDTSFSGQSRDVVNRTSETRWMKHVDRSVISAFLFEAVTAMSICSLLKTSSLNCYMDSNTDLVICDYDTLIDTAVLLASLLESHFFFRPPCGDLVAPVQAAIDWLKVQEIVKEETSESGRGQHLQDRRSQRLAAIIDMNLDQADGTDDKWQREASRNLQLKTSKGSLEKLLSWRALILSDVKSVYHTVTALTSIVDVEIVPVNDLKKDILLKYPYEVEQIDASLNRLEEMLVVDTGYTDYKGQSNTKVLWLTEEYNQMKNLSNLAGRILPFIS